MITDPDFSAMLATPADQRDGKTYVTGLRIEGRHCKACLRQVDTCDNYYIRDTATGMMLVETRNTLCCGAGHCSGIGVADMPWQAETSPPRTVWACCYGVAARHLGEPCRAVDSAASPEANQ